MDTREAWNRIKIKLTVIYVELIFTNMFANRFVTACVWALRTLSNNAIEEKIKTYRVPQKHLILVIDGERAMIPTAVLRNNFHIRVGVSADVCFSNVQRFAFGGVFWI